VKGASQKMENFGDRGMMSRSQQRGKGSDSSAGMMAGVAVASILASDGNSRVPLK
jgi:hypothetical protein